MIWNCVGHEPTRWALGRGDDDFVAKIVRKPDGSWWWYLFEDTSRFGNEPKRINAMKAAEQEYKKWLHSKT